MDYQTAFAISSAGMDVERLRVDVAAMNLAHANTPTPVRGTAYVPLRVVAPARIGAPSSSFDDMIDDGLRDLSNAQVVPSGAPARQVYEPGHPMANRKGFVSYPGVDELTEMLTLMAATQNYAADVAAFNAAKSMASNALQIGGSGS